MAPRKMKLQLQQQLVAQKPEMKLKGLKAKMGLIKQNAKCSRDEQKKIRAKFVEFQRQCDGMKQETEMMIKRTARTQLKLALMFSILKARQGGDSVKAAEFTRLLRLV